MLTAIFLHGHLGERYGKKLELEVDNVAEAIALLRANFATFAQDVIGHSYRVWVGKTNVSRDELTNPAKGQDIHIVPVIAGAGGGLGRFFGIILGVVLIAVDFFTDYAFGGGYLTKVGIGLIAGGVISMIFAPSLPKISMATNEPVEKKVSRYFNGSVNTVGQGNPVPILYGRLLVGSQVISGGFSDADS